MTRDHLRVLFAQARKISGESDFVVLGSLAALGYAGAWRRTALLFTA